jgi:hypothetical protein
MRFIHGHNNRGMDRSGPRKTHYVVEDRGYDAPCWIWQLGLVQPNSHGAGGYGKVQTKGRTTLAHRWYYEQASGPIPKGMQLDHLCRQRDCVRPDHLEPVTPLENTRRSRSSKLTLSEAREVEKLARDGLSSYKIAPMFGVSRQTVDLIRRNGADAPRRQVRAT